MTKNQTRITSSDTEQLRLPIGVEIRDTALIVPATLDDEQILALGAKLRRIQNASQWWIADLVVHVQNLLGSKDHPRKAAKKLYDQLHEIWPQYERSTLKTYAAVARCVPPDLRSSRLSFDHHRHIATLSDQPQGRELQTHFIKIAIELEMTTEDLRLAITDTRHGVARKLAAPDRPAAKNVNPRSGSEEAEPAVRRGAQSGDGLPIPEPELMQNSHAQLSIEAHRSLVRLSEWYRAERKKGKEFTAARRAALLEDLAPIVEQMHVVAEIVDGLSKSSEYEQ